MSNEVKRHTYGDLLNDNKGPPRSGSTEFVLAADNARLAAELAEAKRVVELGVNHENSLFAERDALQAELAEARAEQSDAERDEYDARKERDALRAQVAGLRARVEQLELAAHLAAADFEEARRVASLCLENIRSVVPDPRAALAGPTRTADQPEVVRVEWRPIETAPLDGTLVLLARFRDDGYNESTIEPGRFGLVEVSDLGGRDVYDWQSDYGHIEEPTHWMPLPYAPAVPTTEGKP